MTIALGYNGRGIALATSMGKHLAARLVDAGRAARDATPGSDRIHYLAATDTLSAARLINAATALGFET
jgi:glycine/D-amino acid oxidase-like deaminating enzyme